MLKFLLDNWYLVLMAIVSGVVCILAGVLRLGFVTCNEKGENKDRGNKEFPHHQPPRKVTARGETEEDNADRRDRSAWRRWTHAPGRFPVYGRQQQKT